MLIQGLGGAWQFRKAGADEWLPAEVPGGVHTDLMAAGKIPDPFVADNELAVQWVAKTDWEYRRTFELSEDFFDRDKIFLVCDGLDTLAEVTLNGKNLGRTINAFRRYEWEIKDLLQAGENEIVIAFDAPMVYAQEKHTERALPGVSAGLDGAPYLRKAPSQFGWDWGPKLPPIGIWKDIRVEARNGARFEDVHVRQHHEGGQVRVSADVVAEIWSDRGYGAILRVTAPDGSELSAEAEIVDGAASVEVWVENPALWWPNGYGDAAFGAQPLYQVDVILAESCCERDRRAYQLGLRTIELRREPDEWGESFTFVVNGVPIFAKGSNWIPADSFPTRISDAHLERLIRDAALTHQNMLRVWGGGFYEEERFYDLCDRYGILVWQDFIFSCSVYPHADESFTANVREEVVQNMRRLRHRASLALWCGNNEMEWFWAPGGRWGMAFGLKDMKEAYDDFFHHTLPAWVSELDPDTVYWPSSPSSYIPFEDPNSQERGDAHYWEVWHGRQPFTAFRSQYPRFMSEFGFQALPPLPTIATYAEPGDWNMTSYIMEHHQRSGNGNGLIIHYLTDSFRMPKNFESLVYLSMLLQAEGIRSGVEHWRRSMKRVSGTLYWQLNDCWPVASWASLDYFGRWKALHYAARKFYAPVMLSIEDEPRAMKLHVVSDLTGVWEGSAHWTLETLSGEVIRQGEESVKAGPLTSSLIAELDFAGDVTDANARDVIFTCELLDAKGERLALKVAPFAPNKHLSLKAPALTTEVVETAKNQFAITVGSPETLARFVEVSVKGGDFVFSDNYFDIPAGQTVIVTCDRLEGWDLAVFRDALSVRSLVDSFA